MSRYAVGCAGQHAMHDDSGGASPLHLTTDDVDEAFAACETAHPNVLGPLPPTGASLN